MKDMKGGYIRAHTLGQLEALGQCLGVERGRLGPQSGQRGLGPALHRGLDDAVEAAQHTGHAQLRTSSQGSHESTGAHPGEGGVASLTAPHYPVAQTPAQSVHQGLAERGGALLRRRGALEGEGGATAGRTTGVQLLETTEDQEYHEYIMTLLHNKRMIGQHHWTATWEWKLWGK